MRLRDSGDWAEDLAAFIELCMYLALAGVILVPTLILVIIGLLVFK